MISDNTQLNAVLMTALQIPIASCEGHIHNMFSKYKKVAETQDKNARLFLYVNQLNMNAIHYN